jgi:hypothetical protein
LENNDAGDVKIFQLPPETIETLWPSLRMKLNPAIERSRGLINEANTRDKCASGMWQCWVAYHGTTLKAAVVTRIITAPSGRRVLDAILAGGDDRRLWQRPIVERLKGFMVEEGCQAFQLLGRKGWERVYPEFKVEQIVMEYRP